jgi:Mor family transcriptional regulator
LNKASKELQINLKSIWKFDLSRSKEVVLKNLQDQICPFNQNKVSLKGNFTLTQHLTQNGRQTQKS